ncbi:MAG TPA: ferritin family protein [Smithellaceae bacterium]|nr:ferritin family protein [Smithellaceae bacterium]
MKKDELTAIVEKAIANEDEANRFYQALADKVTDPAAKDTLLYLAKEELKHKAYLERYRQESFISNATEIDKIPDCRVAEFAGSPGVSYNLGSKEAYLLAAARELNSYNLYAGMAALHPEGDIRNMLLQMANEELKHKEKVEYLYSNTAFVQTDGG